MHRVEWTSTLSVSGRSPLCPTLWVIKLALIASKVLLESDTLRKMLLGNEVLDISICQSMVTWHVCLWYQSSLLHPANRPAMQRACSNIRRNVINTIPSAEVRSIIFKAIFGYSRGVFGRSWIRLIVPNAFQTYFRHPCCVLELPLDLVYWLTCHSQY
jgi:hypothetical protein